MTTPSGRSAQAAMLLGADYQHLHAWSEAAHALRPGSGATALAVEAVAAESYDDVAVERGDGGSFVQAKFSVEPAGGFSIDWLLAPVGKNGRSLAERALLAHERFTARGGKAELRLVTNRTLADDDSWLGEFQAPDGTLGHAVERLISGQTSHPAAAEAFDRLRAHLACDDDRLLALLRAWELRWSSDIGNEKRLARARMTALGLNDDEGALLAGQQLIRSLVKDGVRRVELPVLREKVDALGLRLRPPAAVLSVSLIDDEPNARDADVRVDLRSVFAGRVGDQARGLDDDGWARWVAAPIDAAVLTLERSGSRRVLVRAAARLPVWFLLGTRMRQVRDWTVMAELGGRVFSSDDPLAAAPQLSPADPPESDQPTGGALHVAVGVTADPIDQVRSHAAQSGPPGELMRIVVTRPGPHAVAGPAEAARIVDEIRGRIATSVRSGGYREVHLYFAAPRVIPLMLGHRWNGLGTAVVYEDLLSGGYQRAFAVL